MNGHASQSFEKITGPHPGEVPTADAPVQLSQGGQMSKFDKLVRMLVSSGALVTLASVVAAGKKW